MQSVPAGFTSDAKATGMTHRQHCRLGWILYMMDCALAARVEPGLGKYTILLYDVERALLHLLVDNYDKLPAPDVMFHKAFRASDVTDNGHTDMAIWNLLKASTLFWELFTESNKRKVDLSVPEEWNEELTGWRREE